MTNQQLTKEEVIDQFRQTTAICMMWYEQHKQKEILPTVQADLLELQKILEEIWGILCEIYADNTTGWIAEKTSDRYTGYVIKQNSTSKVRVPYHIADYFPIGEVLDYLCEIAAGVRVFSNSVICLSGSATFLGMFEYIADIDYCEYAPVKKNGEWRTEFVNALCNRAMEQNDTLICLRLKIVASEEERVFCRCITEHHTLYTRTISHANLDFGVKSPKDAIEATNLVLPVNPAEPNDPLLQHSFALQEAPITEGNWVPQELLNPISLGEYVVWLITQVKEKQNQDIIKAAKRAVSLARIAGFYDIANKIITVLKEDNLTFKAACISRSHLLKRCQNDNIPDSEEFVNRLKDTIKNSEVTLEGGVQELPSSTIDKLKDIFTHLLREIQQIIIQIKNDV